MNILYGIPGEGMGHATRAKVILEHLTRQHTVRIVSSDRAYKFIHAIYPEQTDEIKGFHIGFRDGVVSKSKTAALTLQTASENLMKNIKKYREINRDFQPDLVISDFESFSYYFAKHHNIPIISIDNMQIINRGKLDIQIPEHEQNNYKVAKAVIKAKLPKCDRYLISAFFDAELRKKNTQLVKPIIRKEIVEAQTATEGHIMVYQSSYGKNGILDVLKQLPNETFYLYGFNVEEDHGNVKMKKFSEQEFISYFASAKAVLANGGYSFISEALYLHKPVCSVPIQNQFEQFVNAAYIEKMGYGKHLSEFNADGIKAFLYDLAQYTQNLSNYQHTDNAELFETIDRAIATVTETEN